ncbi:MAG TPA: N-acetyltransferase, partial [Actinomycetota bacterium]|nr:N-acetyltransferase [Actinomycetota bacterium]
MGEDLPVGEPVDANPARPPGRHALEGRFVRVRPLDPEADAGALWDVSHDGSAQADRLWTYMYDPFADRAAMRAWLDTCATTSDPLFMTVDSRGSGPVGMAAFMNIVPEHRRIEIGH